MRKHAGLRIVALLATVPVLAALLALTILPLGAAGAAAPGAATSAEDSGNSNAGSQADTVLALLGQLQRVNISPEWPPDIQANERSVQALLDAYQACTDAEKAAFTETQNADLRAYFEALYGVQGKDAAGVDALFATSSAASSSPVTVPSEVPASSSAADSSDSASAPVSDPTSQVDSAPDPVTSAASMPQVTGQPQSPAGDGWFGFFSNQALGSTLIVALVILALVLFIRFIVALRKAGRVPKEDDAEAIRAQELFGENYADPDRMELLQNGGAEKPKRLKRVTKPKAEANGADAPAAPAPGMDEPAAAGTEPPPEAAAPGEPVPETDAPEPVPDAPKRAPLARLQHNTFNNPAVSTLPPEVENPPPPGDGPAFRNLRAAFGKTVRLPDPDTGELPETEPAPERPAAESAGPAPRTPARGEPPLGRNPDRADPITTRSFSAPPRTGRPAKMPFRQGDPEDLDAIDD